MVKVEKQCLIFFLNITQFGTGKYISSQIWENTEPYTESYFKGIVITIYFYKMKSIHKYVTKTS